MRDYVTSSLELHLFFARIMKEHAFFLEIGFTKADFKCSDKARCLKEAFEDLLLQAVQCSEGMICNDVLQSGEILTEYTCNSEKSTAQLTGACIQQKITMLETELIKKCNTGCKNVDQCLVAKVKSLNKRALELLEKLIEFKKWVLKQVLCCKMYTVNYPLLIEHIIREAELYQKYVMDLECGCGKEKESIQKVELFWNQIMMEHALFIRGLLDPSEVELTCTADSFACEYRKLLNEACNMNQKTMCAITKQTIDETMKYRDFKAAGTKGINDCSIRSLIVPLLADHTLREANHYLRLLKKYR